MGIERILHYSGNNPMRHASSLKRKTYDLVLSLLPDPSTNPLVLDLPAGAGYLSELCLKAGYSPKGVSPTPIFNQMKKLEETKDMLRSELGAIERTLDESAMPVDLAGYEEFLAALKRGLNTVGEVAKAEIIQKVVSKVEIHPDSATIYYRVSKGETRPPEVAPLGEPKATSQSPEAGEGQKVETPTFFKNRGSTTCFFGGGGGS